MYKKILLFITFFTLYSSVFASNTNILSKIENSIYGFDYSGDKSQSRIARLEKTVYGKGE